MAAEHTVSCPSCGHDRTTRANRGTRLVCPQCGHAYLAPAPAPSPQAAPAPAANGVRVTTARPVIKQVARPRPRAQELEQQELEQQELERLELEQRAAQQREQLEATRRDAERRELLAQAGRRGGLANYVKEKLQR